MEDGTPVLAEQGDAPQQIVFEVADEPIRLIDDADAISRPGAIQRLVIPRIGLDSPVAQLGITRRDGEPVYETVAYLPGQYRGTNPGEGGNVVVAGHVATRDDADGHIFQNLHDLDLGDEIEAHTDDAALRYTVTEIRVLPRDAVEVMAPTAGERLTLITCRSCNIGCDRLVVIAEPVAAPPPPESSQSPEPADSTAPPNSAAPA